MDTPTHDPSQLSQRLEAALSMAVEAGDETLKLFRNKDLQVDRKQDSSPVTMADRAAEKLLRERIKSAFPEDAVLGEEFGETPGTTEYRWILDPIDGTKSFIHGSPLYTTLVAVTMTQPGLPEDPVIGVIYAPATSETVYAQSGGGCWYREGDAPPVAAQVSCCKQLSESLVLTTDVPAIERSRSPDAYDSGLELLKAARLSRTWGDAYGYMMVATGRAEAMFDPAMSLWDAACLKPIIEEAGGSFTDWQGVPTVHTGDAVATNGQITDEVLAFTRGR